MDGESRDTRASSAGDDAAALGRAVMDAVGEGVFQVDGDGRIVAVNDALVEETGFDRDALVGEPMSALLADGDAAEGRAVVEALLSGDGDDSETLDLGVETADGRRDAELHVRAVADGEGAAGVVGTLRGGFGGGGDGDHEESEYRRLLSHLPGVAYRCRNERAWPMEYVSEGCADLVGYDADAVESGEVSWGDDVIHPEDRGDVWSDVQAAVADGGEFELTYRVRTADGDTRWVWEQGQVVDDAEHADGEVLEGFITDVTDQRRTRRELQRERDLNEQVLEASPVGIAVMRPDGSPERANERMEELLGIVDEPTRDLTQEYMTVYDEDGDEVPPAEFPSTRAFETGEPVRGWQAQVEYDDGERRWVAASAVPLADDGDVERVVVTAEDVTDRVEREEALRQERERFQSMVEEVKDYAIFMLDEEGHVESWNEGAERIKGYSEDDILGEHFSQFYTEADREASVPEENLERAAEQGRAEDEGWRVRKDGSLFWANVVITALHDDDGEIRGFTKVTRDMTERREREEALRRERDLVEGIVETSPVSIIVVNRDGEVEKANSRAKRRLGIPDDGTYEVGERPIYDEDDEFVPPDELPYLDVLETGDPVEDWQCQTETAEGERRWVSINAAPLPGDEDRVVVTGEDVTDLKETQRALARERDELESELSELFGRVADAFFALDDDWEFTYLNDRAEELLDRSEADLLGRTIWEEFGGTVGSTFQERYEHAMDAQEPVHFEEYYPPLDVWFSVSAYPSETGLSVYFRDVTDRKQYEQALAELHDVAQALPHAETEGDVAERAVAAAADVLDLPGVAVYLHDEDADELYPAAHSDDLAEYYGSLPVLDAPPAQSVVGDAFARGETVEYEDVQESELLVNPTDDWHRGLLVPLGDHGVLVVGDDQVGGFDERTVELAELLAANAESVLDRVERERALRERERELEEYETVVEQAEDGIFALDTEFRFQMVNEAYADLFDLEPEDMVDRTVAEVLGEDLVALADDLRDAVLAGDTDSYSAEFPAEVPSGETIQVDGQFTALRDDGDVYGYAGVVRDVTERKRRERELERYETIVETVNDGIYVVDETGTFTMVNEQYAEMTGYDRDELVGGDRTLVVDESTTEEADALEAAMREGDVETPVIEATLERADGGTFEAEATFAGLPRDDSFERVGVVRDVTERKRRERELEESERRYRTLAEQFPNGVVTLFDHDLEYTLAAGQAFDYLDVEPDEVEGRSFREVWGDEVADELEPVFQGALDGEQRTVELSYAGREWIVHGVPITHEGGDVFAGMTMAQDITERKRYEDAIRTLHDTTRELFLAENSEEVADLVVTAASEVLGLSDSALYLHDEERGDLYPAAKATDVGVMWDELPRVPPGDDTIVGHVYATGESARWDDIREAPQFIEEETSMRAGVYAPVGDHGAVFAGSSEVGAFDDRTLQLLELLAANAEAAFDRVERERSLEESERRYRTLTEQFPNGAVGLYDDDLRYELVAGPVLPDLGLDADEMEGQTIHEVFPPETANQLEPLFDGALDGEMGSIELEFAGHVVKVWASPVRDDDGEVFAGLSFAQDVTDRVERERALRESERRYRTLAEQFPNGVVSMFDHDLQFTVAGGEAFERFEFSAAEMEGSTVHDLFDGDLAETLAEEYRAALDGESRSFEVEYAGREWRAQAVPLRDDDGEVFAGLVMSQDVTERKRRERELELYETIVETVDDGVYVLDEEFEFAMVNDAYCEMTGYDRDELLGAHSTLVVGDDVTEESADLMAELSEGTSATLEADILRADGTRLPAESNFTALSSPDSESPWKVGVVRDVSERVERERELERYETIVETVNDGICMLDADCRFTMVNDAFTDILGVDRDDVVGEQVPDVIPDEASATADDLREALVESSDDDIFELELVNDAGEERVLDIRASMLGDGPESIIGVVRDVTLRKERERELERALDLLERTERIADVGGWEIDPETMDVFWTDHIFDLLEVPGDEEPPLDEALDMYVEEDQPIVEEAVEDALESGESFDVEVRLRTATSGDVRWLRLQGVPEVEDGEAVSFRGAAQDVTERKQRERELERTLDLLEKTERTADVGGWELDVDTQDVFWSDHLFDILGVAGDEEPPLDEALDVYHEDDRPVVETAIEEAIDEGEPFDVEARFQRPDGELRWLRIQGAPETDGDEVVAIRGAAQDVTERKERERELEQYHTVTQTASDAIVTVDASNVIRSANPAVEDIFGYEPGELVGEPLTTLMPEDRADLHLDGFREYRESDDRTIEWDYMELPGQHRDGSEVPLGVSFSEYEHDGERFFAGVIRDITERKERERELERYETLVETVWDGVYALDDDGDFAMINDAFCEMVGWEREDLVGEPAEVVHTGNTGETAEQMAESVLAGERDIAVLEHELRTKDGDTVPVESRFGPYPYDDDSYGRCGVVRDVTSRLERERELRTRMRQQQVTAELGRLALEEPDLDRLLEEAAEWVAATLGTEVCDVLEFDVSADELRMRQSVGWENDELDDYTVGTDDGGQAIYTLRDGGPVVVDDLASESRFEPPEPLLDYGVESGMSVVVGSADEPWGVLGTHDTERREFSEHDVSFLESVANVLATAVARHRRVREIERQRQHLAALDNLNRVVQDINEALAESSTRQEIERSVCERLVEAEDYALAWIGEVDRNTGEVTPEVWAGEGEEYLKSIDVTVDDSETGHGPTGRAVETMEMQTAAEVAADDAMSPWRDAAREHGFESSAAVPLVYEGALYGVLNVYATRPAAFEGREGDVLSQLGGVVGHAIRSVERKEALMSEHVVELEFRSREAAKPFRQYVSEDAEIRFERTISTDEEGKFLQYVSVEGMAEEEFREAVDDSGSVTSTRLLSERGDELVFELATEDPPLTSRIASHGGRVREAVLADGELRVVAEIPHSVEVRSVVSALSEVASDLELVSQRSTQRDDDLPQGQSAMETLTDKQLAAVEAAFYAGYFDWPRESTAEELAESMDVSAPTLHQHLRKGERKLLAGYFGE